MSVLEKYKKNRHFISFFKNVINDNEEVLDIIKTYSGMMFSLDLNTTHNGLLFCTNQKVCFHRKGPISNLTRSTPLKDILSIDIDKELFILQKIVIHTSNDKIILGCDSFQDAKGFKLVVEKIRGENQESSTQNVEDPIEKIRKLKQLKDEGIITDQEFEEKKKTLMDKI